MTDPDAQVLTALIIAATVIFAIVWFSYMGPR